MSNKNILCTFSSVSFPSYKEIPDVGLYLDQVVKYINIFLCDFPEMQITSSMVSNYVKSKLIDSPYKKTYNRKQIADLIFIAITKTVLSMNHIRISLQQLHEIEGDNGYDTFISKMNHVLHHFNEQTIDIQNASNHALDNIIVACAHKMYLERYFEELQESL